MRNKNAVKQHSFGKKAKYAFFLALCTIQAPQAFADDILPSGMQSLAQSIYGIFTGDFMKIILGIMLAGCAVAYAFNKDNEKIKRNIIAIAIGIAIIMSASFIVGKVQSATKTS
jgi:type IV secretory pathway VirB2 component (pilin)